MLAVVLICALVLWVIKSIYRRNDSGLKDIPNAHFSVPYSRLWLLLIKWNKLENRTRIRLHRRLGPVVRIGPREVGVNCIDDGVRTIFGAKFDKDPSFYHALIDQTVFMVSIIGNEEHKKRRRMLSHYYSNTSIINSANLDGVSLASSSSSVDVFRQCKCCMLDMATDFLFGIENATDTLRDATFLDDLTRLLEPSRKNLHPDMPTREKWEGWLTGLVLNSYRTHATKPPWTHSLFDHFFDNFKAADPDMGFNEMASYMAAECDDHISATHIGLGTLLSYTMYELSRKPDWQRALRRELRTVASEEEEEEQQRTKLIHRLAKLPVLDAVLTETMRTHAPCPGPFPRVVPPSGCRLAGEYDVPGGTIVSSSAWALHFNPIPFPSPDEWRPGRWLEADFEQVAEMRNGTMILYTIYADYETYLDEEFTENVDQDDDFTATPSSFGV
ncbi:putative benzoate 4-monooxygenase cytochrome P450 [Apodospora peruviana]|uniref:Benzoate 4-monooxygenase cytochrome P450 n=1 Tax=Apodospora peruviana TaxID=516989 RepID=A0AAE0M1X4_9PEZI|nr:putative benzoate 4-monooxygenase cytochrome P450 [Apodospora peruviana]